MAPKTVAVTVEYSKPGTQPPVFLAGSFSDPEWLPQEMQDTINEHNEHIYHKEVQVEEGKQYQYKFRIGLGDWWVLNEDSPTVTDNAGNRNNLLSAPMAEESVKNSDQLQEPSEVPPPTTTQAPIFTPESEAEMAKKSGKRGGKSTTARSRPVSAGEDHAAPPALVVEKADTEAHHGDGFGVKATVAQKEAYHRRALDAEPDLVTIRKQTSTPDIAAEVADTAAILDQDPPTPPISDEEAGRIGFRRMSATPIPQVAKTAAEVADVAATLDVEEPEPESPHHSLEVEEDDGVHPPCDSCASTPPNEKVPKFSHETFGLRPPKEEGPCTHEPLDPIPKPKGITPGYEEAVDLTNPNIEAFPTTREEIIERLRRLSEHLPEDVTDVDIAPPSPVIDPNYPPQEFEEATVEPIMIHEVTPLHTIAEEHHVPAPEAPHSFLPVTASAVATEESDTHVSSVEDESLTKDEPTVEEVPVSVESDVGAVSQDEEVTPVEEEHVPVAAIKTKAEEESIAKEEPKVEESHWVAAALPLQYVETAPSKAIEKDLHVEEGAPLAKVESSETDETTSEEESAADEPKYIPIPQTEDEDNASSSSEEELPVEVVKPVHLREIVEESSSEEEASVPEAKPAQIRTAVEESSSEEEQPEEKSLVEEEPIAAVSPAIEESKELPAAKDEPKPTTLITPEVEAAAGITPEEPSVVEEMIRAASKAVAEPEITPKEESSVEHVHPATEELEVEPPKPVSIVETQAEESSEAESSVDDAKPTVFTPTEDSDSKEETELVEPKSAAVDQVEAEDNSSEESLTEEPKVLVVTNAKAEESTPSVDSVQEPEPATRTKVEAEEGSSSEDDSDVETTGSVATSAQPESKSEAEEKDVLTKELAGTSTVESALEDAPEKEQESTPSIAPIEPALPVDDATEIEEAEAHTPMPEVAVLEPVSVISEAESDEETTKPPVLVEEDFAEPLPVTAPQQEIINEVEPASIVAPAPTPASDISKAGFLAITPEVESLKELVSDSKEPEAELIATQKAEEAAFIPITPEVAAVEAREKSIAPETTREIEADELSTAVVQEPIEESSSVPAPEVEVDEHAIPTSDDFLTKEIVPEPEETETIEEAEPAITSDGSLNKDIVAESKEPEIIPAHEPIATSDDLLTKVVVPEPKETEIPEVTKPLKEHAAAPSDTQIKEVVSEPKETEVAEPTTTSEYSLTKEIAPESKEAEVIAPAEPAIVVQADSAQDVIIPKTPEIATEGHKPWSSPKNKPSPLDFGSQLPLPTVLPAVVVDEVRHQTPTSEVSKSPQWAALLPRGGDAVITPFGISDRQLDENISRRVSTGGDSPDIKIQPATPARTLNNLHALDLQSTDTTRSVDPEEETAGSTYFNKPAKSTEPEITKSIEADEPSKSAEVETGKSIDVDEPVKPTEPEAAKSIEVDEPAKPTEVETPKSAPVDTAKSTAIEGEGNATELKSRKPQVEATLTPPARSLTPTSLKSVTAAAGKQAKDGNFLKAFWRAVFVDWIGGLLVRLCGGNKDRNAMVAVGTIAALAIAPVVAFFFR